MGKMNGKKYLWKKNGERKTMCPLTTELEMLFLCDVHIGCTSYFLAFKSRGWEVVGKCRTRPTYK